MSHSSKKSNWHIIAIVCLGLSFFMVGLNRIPVPTVDGVVRASMARNIINTGQLWPITYQGATWTDHPPLYLWLTALSYKIFGINDFAANLVPRLFAFLTVLVTALTALRAGYGNGAALLAALILCLTRDFVLSSVRGYIEPVLEFFIYLALYYSVKQTKKKNIAPAFLAGISVWLAAYSKGPVALWPLLAIGAIFFMHNDRERSRFKVLASYACGFFLCTLIWAAWVEHNNHWHYWKNYLYGQVLNSALKGRDGAQAFEPFYFLDILSKYYWPWLAFLVIALFSSIRRLIRGTPFSMPIQPTVAPLVFFIFGLGFVGGFSLMKWKFWYYIAPAYPAFALFIAAALYDPLHKLFALPIVARTVFYATAVWMLIASIYPVHLHKERIPEVIAFKETIANSSVEGPVWFLHDDQVDHNMAGTSGEWYFDRAVEKVVDDASWEKTKLNRPYWIITGQDFWKTCQAMWCKKSHLIQSSGKSALVYFHP